MSRQLLPPGPKARPIRGFLPEFRQDPLALLTRVAHEYGDIARLQIGPWDFYLLNNPDYIEQVLVTQNRLFAKGRGLDASSPVLGNGLLTSEGEFWRRQRRLAQPAFHRDRITAYGTTMTEYALRHIEPWQDGARLDLLREMMHLTLAIAAKTLFSADVAEEADTVGAALDVTMSSFNDRSRSIIKIPYSWPTPSNRRLEKAVRQLNAIIYRIIDERRASGEDTGDLLSMLLHAVDEDGSQMTPEQLRDETMTLFLAGHETTANTMSWTWYLLGQNPAAGARLQQEVDAVLGDRAPTPADLPRLPYTEAVINEAMRLYPPAWIMGRKATAPFELAGYSFPAGTEVLFSQWVMHRHARWFDDPLAFRPERWLDGLAKRLPAFAFFPFGGGPRMCIGKGFALMEAQLVLATIARRFRFELLPDQPVQTYPTITLRPAPGIAAIAHKR
ncbi:MAG TPA: cytochrome P450 [Symbiobacteriaceae bacterium]|nr:cytochrome P450 [Symbiobacteriaceae bacterium]